MKIGIDIDDTITNTWDTLMPQFQKVFNRPISMLKKSKPYYESVKDLISLDEYYKAIASTYIEYTPKVKVKNDAVKYINKLYDLGHTIYFVTARGYGYDEEYNNRTYKRTENFFKDNNIKYHKLIISANNKGKICKDEGIDILIDDSIKHCTYAKENGIEPLLYETHYNKDDKMFKHASSWKEIYELLKDRW